MRGTVTIIGHEDVAARLLDGLTLFEHRGNDTPTATAHNVLYLGRGTDYLDVRRGRRNRLYPRPRLCRRRNYCMVHRVHWQQRAIFVIAPSGSPFAKAVRNMQKMQTRGGKVVLVSDCDADHEAGVRCHATIAMAKVYPLIASSVHSVPVLDLRNRSR